MLHLSSRSSQDIESEKLGKVLGAALDLSGSGGVSSEEPKVVHTVVHTICRPYLEPAPFARQNLSVEIPFYLAQICVNHKF